MNYEHPCPICNGSGEVECQCCDSEIMCKRCDGSGLDPFFVNIAEFRKAERNWHKESNTILSWEIVVNGKAVGRAGGKEIGKNHDWILLYADFSPRRKANA